MQRHKLEVDQLNNWPDHPITLQGTPVSLVDLILWRSTFHDGHRTKEAEEIGRCENGLIQAYASEDLEVGG